MGQTMSFGGTLEPPGADHIKSLPQFHSTKKLMEYNPVKTENIFGIFDNPRGNNTGLEPLTKAEQCGLKYCELDRRSHEFIKYLAEAVGIPSVSADSSHRPDVERMIDWTIKVTIFSQSNIFQKFSQINVELRRIPAVGTDGKPLDSVPPLLFGQLDPDPSALSGSNPNVKTLLVYAHLDVQPANPEDGWESPPFELTQSNGKLRGRGATDDKGPLVAWWAAIRLLKDVGKGVPLRVKFLFESTEESGSLGLSATIAAHRDSLLADIDVVCITDNLWLGTQRPCLVYGLRGICFFGVSVKNGNSDLHSGGFGGAIHEPMQFLVGLLSSLCDSDGKIGVDLEELGTPLDSEERKLYENVDFDLDAYRSQLGVEKLRSDDPVEILLNLWRRPAFSIHHIEGGRLGTQIPHSAKAFFSIRLSDGISADKVKQKIEEFIVTETRKAKSPCKVELELLHSVEGWRSDWRHWNYAAAARAVQMVYNTKPDYTREGGTIEVAPLLESLLHCNVLLLPIGCGDDSPHSVNEKINTANFLNGIKLLGAYLWELSANGSD